MVVYYFSFLKVKHFKHFSVLISFFISVSIDITHVNKIS